MKRRLLVAGKLLVHWGTGLGLGAGFFLQEPTPSVASVLLFAIVLVAIGQILAHVGES